MGESSEVPPPFLLNGSVNKTNNPNFQLVVVFSRRKQKKDPHDSR